MDLFEKFPYLENDKIMIHKMDEKDVTALLEISHDEEVYKYIPPFLYQKSEKVLATAIKNLGGRDFDKKKLIIAGIYLKNETERLIGLAEMFDYKKRENKITVGYRLNSKYWNQKIATNALNLMVEYLSGEIGIDILQAFVMPENIYSSKVLISEGFHKEDYVVTDKNWGGQEEVTLEVYTYHK